MATGNLSFLQGKRVSQKWNQKLSIKQFQKKYATEFEMANDAIDLRTMSKNFASNHGIIPLEDINQAIAAVNGPKFQTINSYTYDPSGGAVISYPKGLPSPRLVYADWAELFLWSLFQRDVAPNHIEKIYDDFEHTAVLIPNAVKFTIEGKVYYCIWDGHHTLQVCRFQGYSKFPIWVTDIDEVPMSEIVKAGFPATDAGRIKYGVWVAGRNMIRINSKNKRKLSPYDEFMIKLETLDADTVAIFNILTKNNCVVKRHATMAGAFTQIKSGEECYNLEDKYGNKGLYFDRALEFHRKTWPASPLTLEVFRPLSMLYQKAATQKGSLDQQFDVELANLLTTQFGDPETVQEKIKASYENAIYNGLGKGALLDHHKTQVMNGLINLYNDHVGRVVLPPADYVWKV
jgi:hypothetical protein